MRKLITIFAILSIYSTAHADQFVTELKGHFYDSSGESKCKVLINELHKTISISDKDGSSNFCSLENDKDCLLFPQSSSETTVLIKSHYRTGDKGFLCVVDSAGVPKL